MYSLILLVSSFGWLLLEVERNLVVVFGAAHKGLVGQSNAGGDQRLMGYSGVTHTLSQLVVFMVACS